MGYMHLLYAFLRQKARSFNTLISLMILLIFVAGCIAAESPKESNISKTGERPEEKIIPYSVDNISSENISVQQPSQQKYTFIKKSPPQVASQPLDDVLSVNLSDDEFSGLTNQLEVIP